MRPYSHRRLSIICHHYQHRHALVYNLYKFDLTILLKGRSLQASSPKRRLSGKEKWTRKHIFSLFHIWIANVYLIYQRIYLLRNPYELGPFFFIGLVWWCSSSAPLKAWWGSAWQEFLPEDSYRCLELNILPDFLWFHHYFKLYWFWW